MNFENLEGSEFGGSSTEIDPSIVSGQYMHSMCRTAAEITKNYHKDAKSCPLKDTVSASGLIQVASMLSYPTAPSKPFS